MAVVHAPDDEPPLSPAASGALVGTVLRNTYRIDRVLDQGGMGMVYAGEHLRLGRPLAVKVLASHLAADGNALARFQREAEIVSRLQHPHVVNILDFDATDDGEPYIVMELLQGESLGARLERERSLALHETVRIVQQVASALAAAHADGIVHRDLKPANIFLVQVEHSAAFVKLLDFGISKVAHAVATRRVTREFDVLGTPDYMAPEQALGRTAQVDGRADQFALAVIAFEMLAERVPFQDESVMGVLYRVAHEAPPLLSSVAPGLPGGLDAVLARAMRKAPEERFANIVEFSTELARAAGSSLHPSLFPPARAPAVPPSQAPTPTAWPEPPTGVRSAAQQPTLQAASTAALDDSSTSAVRPTSASLPPPLGRSILNSSPPQRTSRPPATRSEPPPTRAEVAEAIARARQAAAFEELDLAVDYAASASRLAERSPDGSATALLEEAAGLFERIYLGRLGGKVRRLLLRQLPSSDGRHSLTPEQAFLVSRIDNNCTVEELLDVSPLPVVDTLRVLVSLVRSKLIELQ